MATGLGAFAQGFAQGYGQMSEIEARNQAMERDKQRIALDEKRAAMDEQRFGLEKQQAELGMQKTGMEIAALKLNEDHRKAMVAGLDEVDKYLSAENEGEVIDTRTGKVVGFKRFNDLKEVAGPLMEQGQTINISSVKRTGPISSPLERMRMTAEKMHSINMKYGKIDEKDLAQMENNYRRWQGQDIEKAMNYFLTSNDEKGAKDILIKAGVKIDPNDKFLLQKDPQTGETNMVVGAIGKDGKFQKKYDMFDFYFSTVSPAEAAKFRADMKKSGLEQSQENVRTSERIAGGIIEARIRSNADKSGGDKKIDRLSEEINSGMKIVEDSLKLSANVTQNKEFIERKFRAASIAHDLVTNKQAKSVNEAIAKGWEMAGLPTAPARTAVQPPK